MFLLCDGIYGCLELEATIFHFVGEGGVVGILTWHSILVWHRILGPVYHATKLIFPILRMGTRQCPDAGLFDLRLHGPLHYLSPAY
jgi:hypothetical protein